MVLCPLLTTCLISPSWNSLARRWSTLPPAQLSTLPNQFWWQYSFSSPGQQESSLTFTSTGVFVVRITFVIVILCDAWAFELQWSKECKLENLSRHLHSTLATLPKPWDGQEKGSQQGIKSVRESSRGADIHRSPHQVLFFPSYLSSKWEKRSVTSSALYT